MVVIHKDKTDGKVTRRPFEILTATQVILGGHKGETADIDRIRSASELAVLDE